MSDLVDTVAAFATMVDAVDEAEGIPMAVVLIMVPIAGGPPQLLSNVEDAGDILEFCAEHHHNAVMGVEMTEGRLN